MPKNCLKRKASFLTCFIVTTVISLDFMVAKPAMATDIEYVLCKRVVQSFEQTKDNPTEKDVLSALEGVSQLFPKREQSKVDVFVEQYGNELAQILSEERDPSLACTLLGVSN